MSSTNDLLIPTMNKMGFMFNVTDPITETFVEHCKKCAAPVADLGVAYGKSTKAALETGVEIYANDLEKKHLDVLYSEVSEENKKRLHLIPGNVLTDIHFKENMLEGVLANMFIHFLTGDEIEVLLKKIHGWLKSGGKFFMTAQTPYLGALKNFLHIYEQRQQENVKWPGYFENIHAIAPDRASQFPNMMHFLNKSELTRVLKETGFEIEHCEYFARPYMPEDGRLDGREGIGVIAIKK